MPLTKTMIKNELTNSEWIKKDNTAQKLINNATPTDIRLLEVEPILRLYEALVKSGPSRFSANDAAALKKLKVHSQYQPAVNTPSTAVSMLKQSFSKTIASSLLSTDIVKGVYAAEKKRLHFLERIGIDGDSIGRGQVTQKGYSDVKIHKDTPWSKYFTRVAVADLLARNNSKASKMIDFNTYKVIVPKEYSRFVHSSPALEDFVVASYLCISINKAAKPNRSDKDTLKFGVGYYHGMFFMMQAAQKNITTTQDWDPVQAELIKMGKQDEVDYVNEVVQ